MFEQRVVGGVSATGAATLPARKAASALSGASVDGDSIKTELLRDVQAVFTRTGTDRLSSAALAGALGVLPLQVFQLCEELCGPVQPLRVERLGSPPLIELTGKARQRDDMIDFG